MLFDRRSVLICAFGAALCGRVQAAESLWTALRSGEAVALLRHAEAPGVGDPAGFRLGDCSTQRNLSPQGRAQATAIGELFRTNGITAAQVYSSQWCRCLDTAHLLALGEITPLEPLNSFFEDRSTSAERTAALLAWLRRQPKTGTVVLVTHQVNITAFTGQSPRSGEMIVVRVDADRPVEVMGRLSAAY